MWKHTAEQAAQPARQKGKGKSQEVIALRAALGGVSSILNRETEF
jgi:hypothetical protein